MASFIEASRSECKLTLGRNLFRPEEVVDRIVATFKTSNGVRDSAGLEEPFVAGEQPRATVPSPLRGGDPPWPEPAAHVYWVAQDTGSRHNALVEFPHDTVVAVIKPPGSDGVRDEARRRQAAGAAARGFRP